MFDIDFGNNAAYAFTNLLKSEQSQIISLRFANTHVGTDVCDVLLGACLQSPVLRTLRWVNLLPLREGTYWDRAHISKVIQIESRKTFVTRGCYLNVRIGDLANNLVQDKFKC